MEYSMLLSQLGVRQVQTLPGDTMELATTPTPHSQRIPKVSKDRLINFSIDAVGAQTMQIFSPCRDRGGGWFA